MQRLKDKVAIITGGAGGMGHVAAKTFTEEGACVVLADRDADKLQAVVKEVSAGGAKIFEEAVKAFGKVDILINNAGWGCKLPFLETDEASFDRSIELNVKATYYMTQLACKQMIKQGTGGKIVNTSSTAALQGERNGSIYAGSKSAIIAMSKAIALEVGEYGINVNVVCPGFTRTDNNGHIPSAIDDNFLGITPTKRINVAQDIVNGYLFLVSEEARQITAQVLPIDGGFSGTRAMQAAQNASMMVK